MDLLSGLWTYVLPFLVILTVVVFVHELGHFLVARWNGVKVEVFSVGFGREIVGFTDRHGTRWRISLIPLGGYVKFFGDANEASAPGDVSHLTDAEQKVAFPCKRVGQRAAIVFAGPAANFVFAILVFAAVFATSGRPFTAPVIGTVVDGSPAQQAGLQPGDTIVAIAGIRITRFEEIQQLVPLYGAEPMAVTLERNGEELTVTTHPQMRETKDALGNVTRMPVLGVAVGAGSSRMERLELHEALGEAVMQTWRVTSGTFVAFGQMLTGKRGTEDLGGPLRIAEYSGQAAQMGLINLVMFVAVLSVNLGLINLFPIPVLDGGHLILYAFEALRGRPLGDTAQQIGLKIGLMLLLGVMIFTTWNDILRFVRG
ncbi:RIP metalloprotease RseP [Novispirillum itersonii]|uniref:Zinc metalloprotease n=1 Tax=Novispirillum itersonii TaxID=189 RepID=A0A7W9ZF97_NOVIT|nr:RIP metalloprotease RseP [Novispirillum itersonii]MBB6210170.1 regulator of sigma E protease [Novispirillum itersonii]